MDINGNWKQDTPEGVTVPDIEPPPRLQAEGHNLRPAVEVWQPGQHAAFGVHDIELAVEPLWQGVDIRADEFSRDARNRAELPGLAD